jgi:ABC-2 type transport system ATP-binding protein
VPKDETGDVRPTSSESSREPSDLSRDEESITEPSRSNGDHSGPDLSDTEPEPGSDAGATPVPKPASAHDAENAPRAVAGADAVPGPVSTAEAAPDARTAASPELEADPDSPRAAIQVTDLSLKVRAPHRSWWARLLRRTRLVSVIDGLSFTVEPGDSIGYVGAAGAGKSVLVDLITGAAAPTSGTVRTWGLTPDAEREAVAHRIGVVSGSRSQLWRDLSLDESLRILARAHQLSDDRWLARRSELIERLELAAFIALPADKLSRSRRIRGELAAALIHDPELLILDEPTLGLDVLSKEKVRTFLRQDNQAHGRTLLLATSDLADVEQICRRVLVVDHGRLVHDGDLPGLINRAGAQRTLVVDLTEADRILDDVPGAKLIGVEAGGLRQRLHFTPGGIPSARILADVAARSGIRHLTLEEPDLEELIRRL